ncbi:MAG TPA: aminodeoxychorismate lyase [Steroidobacteraceae bacterium]|nr:aminodeoxychorismate lyase [Gammaproteobacteria bacterium]HEV2284664.1 aminodeoxychorismate lyase [Steroidobacteraceae bacterium]
MRTETPSAGALESVRIDGRVDGVLAPLERGLHYGDGLFETIACLGGRPRFLERHLERLAYGCERLGIGFPGHEALGREILAVAGEAERAVVKVLLTRGAAAARGYAVAGSERPTRVTLRYRWEAEDPALARDGVRVRMAELRLGENPHLAGLKHLNRLEQVEARREWSDPGIAEALMFSSSGRLVSGVMSNVFLVQAERLRTPRLDRCGVAGIMRAAVLRAAAQLGIAAEEAALDAGDLAQAREIFLTSALIGVRPVRELAGRAVAPGPVTRALQQALAPLLAGAADA